MWVIHGAKWLQSGGPYVILPQATASTRRRCLFIPHTTEAHKAVVLLLVIALFGFLTYAALLGLLSRCSLACHLLPTSVGQSGTQVCPVVDLSIHIE